MSVKRRRIGWSVSVLALCALIAISFLVGKDAGSSSGTGRAVHSAPPTVITAPVRYSELSQSIQVSGSIEPSNTWHVPIVSESVAGAQSIVTAPPLKVGSVINQGSVIAQVAGRPIFAFQGSTPMYRNIAAGDSGSDVTQLRNDLATIGFGSNSGTHSIKAIGTVVSPRSYQVSIASESVAGAQSIVTERPLTKGSIVRNGSVIAQVAGRPVFAFQGLTPMYRSLSMGSKGPDVAELNRDLSDLGYRSTEKARTISFGATVVSANITPITLGPQLVAGAESVVTAQPVSTGSTVSNGSIIAQLAGQPVFVFQGSVPMYRSLSLGDKGPDVSELQGDLKVLGYSDSDPVGTFGSGTVHAVEAFYTAAGFNPPIEPASGSSGSSGSVSSGMTTTTTSITSTVGNNNTSGNLVLPQGSIVFVPSLPAVVEAEHLRIGQLAPSPAMTLASGAMTVDSTLNGPEATLVSRGDRALITGPPGSGGPYDATVTSVVDNASGNTPSVGGSSGSSLTGGSLASGSSGSSGSSGFQGTSVTGLAKLVVVTPNRPLPASMVGADVNVDVTVKTGKNDIFDAGTEAALRAFYAAKGYSVPQSGASGGFVLPDAEVVFVPSLPAVVEVNHMTAGSPVPDPSLTLGSGRLTIDASLPSSDGMLVSRGDSVQITSSSNNMAPIAGTVESVVANGLSSGNYQGLPSTSGQASNSGSGSSTGSSGSSGIGTPQGSSNGLSIVITSRSPMPSSLINTDVTVNIATAGSDTFGASTISALKAFYIAKGYSPPPSNSGFEVPQAEIVFVPNLPAVVISNHMQLGQVVPSSAMTLGAGQQDIVLPVTGAQASLISKGDLVKVTDDAFVSDTITGRVTAIRSGSGAAGSSGVVGSSGPSGSSGNSGSGPVSIVVTPIKPLLESMSGNPVSGNVITATTSRPVLSVPISAMYALPNGSSAVKVVNGKHERQVIVRTLTPIGGQVPVVPVVGKLAPGERVLLGG